MKENILFILSLESKYNEFKRTQVLNLTSEEQAKLNNVYRDIYGRNLPNCSSCFADAFLSLLIFSRQQYDQMKEQELNATIETAISQSEIEAATIADDEHKPRRKRK